MNTANLSSILEQLSLWEKKLYKEVKDEERLRRIYAKEQKKLKKLDDRGVESSKIDATYNSIKKLLLKIKVAVSTVDAISKRINKLRDEELRPRLNELILSLTGMWTFMVDCHRKQFLAMLEGKTQLQIAQAAIERNSSIMAVRKLETDILNWATAFTYWISTQKSFVKFLNGCLMKCLLKEPEETPDGIAPFSPTRLGAPPIFITCNDWYNAIEIISGAGVSKAMHEFASMLNQLGNKLDEEKRQRLKVEYLAKDLEKRVKTLYEESEMNWEQYVLSNNAAAAEVTTESGILIPDGLHVDLKPMKNRLDDEKARRMEAIMQANDIASQGFRAGLVRVFEALDGFSGEMLKALEQVRFPKGEEGTDWTGMWTFRVDCHRKQFLAMLEAKAQFQAIERNSSIMAIRKLETDILNWVTAFTYWINTQKSFVKFLNECLMKCLLKESEEMPDGIAPFSPTSLGLHQSLSRVMIGTMQLRMFQKREYPMQCMTLLPC